jgi:hypothetical protein
MVELTERAQATLESYLDDVTRSVAGRPEVDAAEVVAGIREHVEAELSARLLKRATVEEVADVLDHLGPPSSWRDTDSSVDAIAKGEKEGTSLAALALVGAGAVLVLSELSAAVGWAALLAGAVLARLAIREQETPTSTLSMRLSRGIWRIAATAGVVLLLIGPAVLVWISAQIGGLLEDPLTRRVGVDGPERPLRFWGEMLGIAGVISGGWWMFVGLVVKRFAGDLRRGLGSARGLLPPRTARVLLISGFSLLFLSLLWLLI